MNYQQVLALIQQYIVANGNNEITANVLRPILEAILAQPNELIGDLDDLQTTDQSNLVSAINELMDADPFNPSDYDLDEFQNGSADPYARESQLPAPFDPITDASLFFDPITKELRANVSDFSEKYTYTGGVQEFVLTDTPTKIIYISVNGQLLEDPLTQWSIDVPTKTITILDELDTGDRVTVHYQYFITI